MRRFELEKLLFRAQVHLGLTRSEFRGFLVLAALLASGILIREFSLRVPHVDPEVYERIEREFRQRSNYDLGQAIGPEPWAPPVESVPVLSLDKRLDLNLASSEELQRLPRIGPRLAQRILDHRDRFGPFRTVDDLRMIQGIGQATLDGLRALVVVQPLADSLDGAYVP